MQMLCLMYVGLQQTAPEIDIQFDLSEEDAEATKRRNCSRRERGTKQVSVLWQAHLRCLSASREPEPRALQRNDSMLRWTSLKEPRRPSCTDGFRS